MPIAQSAQTNSTRTRNAQARVWLFRTADWRSSWARLLPLVDEAQRLRCASVRDPQLRRDRLLAHALHRSVLAEALSVPPDRVPLYRATGGQPRLTLPGLYTSLSHAREVIAVALAPAPIGVDVEMRETASLQPIADLVCSREELSALPADGVARDRRLLELWVRKEAALKAAGVGLARPMSLLADPGHGAITLRDTAGAPLELFLQTLGGTGDCVVAVACPQSRPPAWGWRDPLPLLD